MIINFQLKPSISQFPQHTDLQKVGEVIFNNEKYNILKVTTHTVTDYFEDFMLGKLKPNPTKRFFVDDNSLSHQWSGFNEKSKSLRKTEILENAFVNVDSDNTSMLTSKENETLTEKHTSVVNKAVPSNFEDADKNENGPRDTNIARTVKEDVNKSESTKKGQPLNSANEDRNVVQTTFFCPFLGVISMSAFVD